MIVRSTARRMRLPGRHGGTHMQESQLHSTTIPQPRSNQPQPQPRLNHPSCRIQERFRHNLPTSAILQIRLNHNKTGARQIYRACFNVPPRNSRFTGLLLDSPIASAPRTLENDHRAVFAYLERIAHCLRHNLDRRFKGYAGIAVCCVSTPDATAAIAARIVVAKSFFIISRPVASRGYTS